MITESPCHIKAAPRWYSVSRNIKALTPNRLLSEMAGQPTVLFNAFTTVILHHKHRICQPPIAFTILEIPISQSYISRLEKKIMQRLKREMVRYE